MFSWAGPLILAFLVGVGLGTFFFGSLWLTVRRLSEFRRPGLVMMGLFVARMTVVVVGIYFVGVYLVAQERWRLILVCLGGLVLARTVLIRWLRPEGGGTDRRPGPRGPGSDDDGEA